MYFAPGKGARLDKKIQTINMSQSELLGATPRLGIFVQCRVCEGITATRDLLNHEPRLLLPVGRLRAGS